MFASMYLDVYKDTEKFFTKWNSCRLEVDRGSAHTSDAHVLKWAEQVHFWESWSILGALQTGATDHVPQVPKNASEKEPKAS